MGVNQSYAASEAMPLALPCRYGWLRLNSDWFLVEPIAPKAGLGTADRWLAVGKIASAFRPITRSSDVVRR